jgi:hypothetical protein
VLTLYICTGRGVAGWSGKAIMLKDIKCLRDINPVYGAEVFGKITLEELYHEVSKFELPLSVPGDVRRGYDAIRHAYIFSYYSYDLVTLAANQILPCLELALRERMQPHSKGTNYRGRMRGPKLHKLLNSAKNQGLISGDYASLNALRNILQHGNAEIFDPNMFLDLFETVTELLRELYQPLSQVQAATAEVG